MKIIANFSHNVQTDNEISPISKNNINNEKKNNMTKTHYVTTKLSESEGEFQQHSGQRSWRSSFTFQKHGTGEEIQLKRQQLPTIKIPKEH